MTLQDQLKYKLNLTKEQLDKAKSTYNVTLELIRDFFIQESVNDELNRLFALKKGYLEKIKQQLELLEIKCTTLIKYRDIIPHKQSSLENTLIVINEYLDELSNIISELQAISIFLDGILKS